MRATRSLALAVVAVVIACATAAPAHAQQQNNQFSDVFPIEVYTYDYCTGEYIYLTGYVYIGFDIVFDKAGGADINFQFRAKADGIGLSSGWKYAINNSAKETTNINPKNPQYNDTFTQHWKLISQGPGENGYIRQTIHITVNANGTWTAVVDNESIEYCLE